MKRLLASFALTLASLPAWTSAVFDGTNDQLRGTFNSQYGDSLTIAVKIKIADHPNDAVSHVIAQLGDSNSSVNDSYSCRLGTTDNQLSMSSIDSGGTTTSATTIGFTDNTWFSIICTINNDDGSQAGNARTVVTDTNSGNNDTTRTVAGTLDDLGFGESLADTLDFTGRIAEVAIWDVDISGADETAYIANDCTANIDPTNLIGYWALIDDADDFTNEGTDTGGDLTASGNAAIDADHPTMGACSATPTFTSAPAIGTRTTSTIPVTFTSDMTGTVHGVSVTDGSGTPTCAEIDGETATGEYLYFHEAVTATVADTGTFSSYTDGTVRDGYFCIEEGASNYSSVASIANMYKIPAFTTPLTIASQTDTTYTSNSKVLDGPGLVDLVACVKDASAPSVAQTEAGAGGCIINGSEDDATGTMTLNPSGTAFPIYDLYYVGSYGGQSEAAVHALVDEYLDPPSGKQQITLTSVHATSPYFGTAVAAGDICTIDLVTSPNAYVVTDEVDGTISYAASGDNSRQIIQSSCYDVSSPANIDFTLVYNNQAPTVDENWPFPSEVLFQFGVNPAIDLTESSSDPELDDIDFTLTSGALPTDWVLTSETGIINDGTPGACGTYEFEITLTDTYGATTEVPNTVYIGPLVPDVVNQSEASAIAEIEGFCTLDAVEGTAEYSGTIAVGNVIRTDPVATTLVAPDQVVTYILSLGGGPPSFIGDASLLLAVDELMTPIVLEDRWDSNDTVTVTFQDALPTGLSVSANELIGTPTSCETVIATERGTVTGPFYAEVETTIVIGARINVVGMTEAAAIAAIEAACQ